MNAKRDLLWGQRWGLADEGELAAEGGCISAAGRNSVSSATLLAVTLLAAVLISTAGLASVASQYQVNTQLNTELYGRGVGSVRAANLPFNQATLRSDFRHDAFLSGSLRSDIRGQYGLVGPLAPSGALSYIPSSPRPYGSLSSPSGIAYAGGYAGIRQNPGGVGSPIGGASSLLGQSSTIKPGYGLGSAPWSGSPTGSMRYAPYSSPYAAPAVNPGTPLATTPRSAGAPFSPSPMGSIRFGR